MKVSRNQGVTQHDQEILNCRKQIAPRVHLGLKTRDEDDTEVAVNTNSMNVKSRRSGEGGMADMKVQEERDGLKINAAQCQSVQTEWKNQERH